MNADKKGLQKTEWSELADLPGFKLQPTFNAMKILLSVFVPGVHRRSSAFIGV
jgi:hypothetical protein